MVRAELIHQARGVVIPGRKAHHPKPRIDQRQYGAFAKIIEVPRRIRGKNNKTRQNENPNDYSLSATATDERAPTRQCAGANGLNKDRTWQSAHTNRTKITMKG